MKTPHVSVRAQQTPPSPIRKLAYLAKEAKAAGRKVYHLNIGQPDIRTPPEFFEGLRRYQQEIVAYDDSQGNDALCKAWASYFNRNLALDLKPEQLLITEGASEALIFLFMTCCDPGDEVVIFDPTYANYIGFAAITGVKLVPIHCSLGDNFDLPSRQEIKSKITDRTKAVLLCNPNNPTGTVYSREQLRMLIEICEERNIFFIVDETYREFVYDGLEPLSVFQLEPRNPRIIVVDSLSKRFSICGARIGCLVTCNEEVLAATLNIAQARLCAPTIEQVASAHMLDTISDEFVNDVRDEYQNRRNVLFDALSAIPGVVAHRPKGAFYSVVGLPVENAERFAAYLLGDFAFEGATTFVAPAAGFYMENGFGLKKVRVAYVLNTEDIKRAVNIIERGLQAYQN